MALSRMNLNKVILNVFHSRIVNYEDTLVPLCGFAHIIYQIIYNKVSFWKKNVVHELHFHLLLSCCNMYVVCS